MYRRNYRSDFDFILKLKSCTGEVMGWPEVDWTARFYTPYNKANAYVASCIGGECVNCYNDGGQIHIVCDNHHLGMGQLMVDFTAIFPDSSYPDGNEKVLSSIPLDIELVRDATCCPTAAEVEATVPFIVRGLLESEAPLLGEILDRVNSTFDAILGPGGATPGTPGAEAAAASSPTAPRYLQRGIISIYARPGVVYRNCGQIRLPGKRRIFDLSGIPSIQSVSAFIKRVERPDLVKYDSEAKTVEILEAELEPIEVRVNVYKPSEDKYYIMKSEDGSFDFYNKAFHVVDRPLEAPVVPRGCYKDCFTLQDVLDTLPLAYKIEVQKKERHYKRILQGKGVASWHKRHKIKRIKTKSGGTFGLVDDSIEGSYVDSRGVFRIRYLSKKKKSAWTVFSIRGYYVNEEFHAFVTPL